MGKRPLCVNWILPMLQKIHNGPYFLSLKCEPDKLCLFFHEHETNPDQSSVLSDPIYIPRKNGATIFLHRTIPPAFNENVSHDVAKMRFNLFPNYKWSKDWIIKEGKQYAISITKKTWSRIPWLPENLPRVCIHALLVIETSNSPFQHFVDVNQVGPRFLCHSNHVLRVSMFI